MSVREQERRAREAMSKAERVEARIERRMQEAMRQADEAMLRAEEVRRRIEVGDVQPRPLPSLREDSLPSTPSSPSIPSDWLSRSSEGQEEAALVLTPVGGQTRVSDVNADEGRPHNAGSNTTLPARI
jgi:hypothetical protein